MGFLDELNDAFMDGLKKGPSPSWFGGLKVKRTPSPIAMPELNRQHQRVTTALTAWQQQKHSDWSGEPDQSFADLIGELDAVTCFDQADIEYPQDTYLYPVWRTFLSEMAAAEPMFQVQKAVDIENMAAAKRLELHEQLTYLERVLEEPDAYLDAWSDHLFAFVFHLLKALPEGVGTAPSDADLSMSCPLVDCLADPHQELATVLPHFEGADSMEVRKRQLFLVNQEKILRAVLNFSKLKLEDLEKKQVETPLNHTTVPAAELVPQFLGKTPFTTLLMTPVPYGF